MPNRLRTVGTNEPAILDRGPCLVKTAFPQTKTRSIPTPPADWPIDRPTVAAM